MCLICSMITTEIAMVVTTPLASVAIVGLLCLGFQSLFVIHHLINKI